VTLGYKTAGHGEHKVIALHGWLGDHSSFDPLLDALSLGEFTYAFPAYRGYGLSKHLSGEYSMKEISADIIDVANALDWGKFSLVGHSMGGKATQRVLIDAPLRIRRIVVIAPAPACEVPLDAPMMALFEGAARNLDNRRTLIDFATGNRLSKAWIDRIARYSAETSNVEAFAGYFRAWQRTDFSADISGWEVPLKVIAGEHDLAVTPADMEATYLAWNPMAEMEVMPNAGHFPMNETPVMLATAIEAFLRKR
jgi:pimeloyl-ACP methyl ester carboxylesterase